MTLKDTLQQMKLASRSKLPTEVAAVMTRATENLETSGRAGRALGTGKTAPEFELPDSLGTLYNSRKLRSKGPLILSFYRGSW